MRKVTILDLSGQYKEAEYEKHFPDAVYLDLSDISGTNCYLDDAARAELENRLAAADETGLILMDSGNYHYLSLFFLERIHRDFNLVVFDNHPDMQTPGFGKVTSCGSWVQEAMESFPYLKQVSLIGVREDLVEELELHSNPRVEFELPERLPVYLSVDKDVLRTEDAVTDWDQGNMTLTELLERLKLLQENYEILGINICGDSKDLPHGREQNLEVNRELLELLAR